MIDERILSQKDIAKKDIWSSKSTIFKRLLLQREMLLLMFILLFSAYASYASPYFLNFQNFKQVLLAISMDAVVAVGMSIVLVGGGIDLSVGSIIGFSAAMVGISFGNHLGIPLTLLIGLASGVLIGAINGLLVATINITPLIATLAMMGIARSGTYILSKGYPFSTVPKAFTNFAAGGLFGIPNTAVVALVCVILFHVLLSKNVILRKFYFLGGNEAAAFRAGLPVGGFKFLSYVITGLFSALAAILLVSRMGSTFPHSGLGTEIRVISACIIGGCSINGGKGTVVGPFLGVLLLGLIQNMLVLLNVSVYWQGIVSGVILILAVSTDALLNRRKY